MGDIVFEDVKMSKSIIEVTPKAIFGCILICIGLILLAYITVQCVFLANGTISPLEVSEEPIGQSQHLEIFYGIILQIGMYGLLILVSFVLVKTGVSIAKP